jgi:Zn finger protein HypA/HybF involved in hydrogenase expression
MMKVTGIYAEDICICLECHMKLSRKFENKPCPHCGSNDILITVSDKCAGAIKATELMDLGLKSISATKTPTE